MRTHVLRSTSLLLSLFLLTACPDEDPGGGTGGVCGNGRIDGDEVCDGEDLGGATCVDLGFGEGPLGCRSNCQAFDLSGCGAPETCGNDVIDGNEACDGTDLGGTRCDDLGYGPGHLACLPNCADFDVSGCGAPTTCGNGALDDGEVCDGALLGGARCQDLGFDGGTLACAADCQAFDTSGCETACEPQCGDRECGIDPVCGEPCGGGCDDQFTCDETAGVCVRHCDLDAIDSDLVLALDVRPVDLTAHLTVGGAPIPDSSSGIRGTLRFEDLETGRLTTWTIPQTGDASAEVSLLPATYRVELSTGGQQDVLPHQRIVLEDALEIGADTGALFLDLEVIDVSFSVLLDGPPLPDDPDGEARGLVVFQRRDTTDETTVELGAAGPATRTVSMFSGTYDVRFRSNARQSLVPNQGLSFATGLELPAQGSLQWDLRPADVAFDLRLDGATFPDGTASRGLLRFLPEKQIRAASVVYELDATGPVQDTVRLLAGTYDIEFVARSGADIPLQSVQLAKGFELPAAGANRTFDLTTVDVPFSLTLGNEPLPDGTRSRGTIFFVRQDTGHTLSVSLSETGPVDQSVRLFAGPHTVRLSADQGSGAWPLGGTTVVDLDFEVTPGLSARTWNVDVHPLEIEVTLDGAVLPDRSEQTRRGRIALLDLASRITRAADVPPTGPGTVTIPVFAGAYSVSFDDRIDGGDLRQTVRLAHALKVDGSTPRQVHDLRRADVSLSVLLDGAPLPDNGASATSTRGSVFFRRLDTAHALEVPLGNSGAVDLEVPLLTGAYHVEVRPGADQDLMPRGHARLLRGCRQPAPCDRTDDSVTGTWFMESTDGRWGTYVFVLDDSSGTLEASFDGSYGSGGQAFESRRDGDRVWLEIFAPCRFAFDLEVNNACDMSGRVVNIGCVIPGAPAWGIRAD